MEQISLTLSILAVVTSIVTAIIVYQQTIILGKTNTLPILVDLFREFRSNEFKGHQFYIYNQLQKECSAVETGYSKLPPTAASHVMPVSFFYDNVGVLVVHGVISEALVISFMGGPIMRTWKILEPYIRREREFRNEPYQFYFEHMAALTRTTSLDRVNRKLKLKKMI